VGADKKRVPPLYFVRFHLGPVPQSESLETPPGVWTPLRPDFGPKVTQLIAIPIGGVAFVVVGWLWIHATPVMKNLGGNPNRLVVELIASMFALIPVHELLHAVVHPDFGMTRKTVLAVWPSHLLCYTYYDGPRSRERLLIGMVMPLLVITFLPLVIGIVSGHASVIIAFVSSLNALGAAVDIFGIGLLLWQVPSCANVMNQGRQTYWSQPA
jgi:hypothetical protein